MRQSAFVISTVIASASQASAWPRYNPMIPNGANVNGGTNIGHVDEAGEEGLSEFGAAFGEAGDMWTTELCQADSDGDGQTNGQELGDPCCEFVYETNEVVRWTTGVSHPSDSASVSNPSLWESIDCSSPSTTTNTTSADTTTEETTVEETTPEGTSTDEASTENKGSAAAETSTEGTVSNSNDEPEPHSHSGSSPATGATASSSGSAQTTVTTSAPTPAATNSATHNRAFVAGASLVVVAVAALW